MNAYKENFRPRCIKKYGARCWKNIINWRMRVLDITQLRHPPWGCMTYRCTDHVYPKVAFNYFRWASSDRAKKMKEEPWKEVKQRDYQHDESEAPLARWTIRPVTSATTCRQVPLNLTTQCGNPIRTSRTVTGVRMARNFTVHDPKCILTSDEGELLPYRNATVFTA